MSWSDDTRCLFCDGKLPLFRKLAQGQFCSKAHQESYWKEQDQLALDVLHRTHDKLTTYKLAAPIESILGPAVTPAKPGPAPTAAEVVDDRIPGLQGLTSQAHSSRMIPPAAAAIVAADPLEYEIQARTNKPRQNFEPRVSCQLSSLAGILAMEQTGASWSKAGPLPASPTILDGQLGVVSPALSIRALTGLTTSGLVAMPPISPGKETESGFQVQPVAFTIPVALGMGYSLAPCGDALERLELETFPRCEKQLALSAPLGVNSIARAVGGGEFLEFREAAVERPYTPEVAAQPKTLVAAVGLASLPQTTAGRDWRSKPAGFSGAIEPRAAAVSLAGLKVEAAASDPVGELLSPTQHAPLLPLAMIRVQGGAHNPLHRPVSYQEFVAEGSLQFPDSAKRRVAFSAGMIRTFASRIFRLKMAERIQPREGEKRLRPGFVAAPAQPDPLLPKLRLEPLSPKPSGMPAADRTMLHGEAASPSHLAASVKNFWSQAPRDLKLLLFAVPIAIGLAFHPSLPKVSVDGPQAESKAVTGQFKEVLNTQVANLRKSIADRAAVGLDENFRQGLDNWMSYSGSTTEWSFDQAGFVQPGRVALYQPSLGLTDYELQFLGAIDKGALSWVTRAVDFQNYYVVKLVVVKDGPVPQMGITRYAVIDGKPVDRVDTPVTLSARTDSLYRVSHVMEGDHHALVIQGQMIDSWTEPRLKRGGVGFFTNRGEESRIGWVQITHQYDMLGRLFAYLAP